MKPKLFVGSSKEALHLANAVHENLTHEVEVTVWNQGIFNLSEPAVDSLLETLDRMDFGVFVFAPDDVVNIRGEQNRATRDNVVFELGLYIGHLGRQRSFVFLPRDQGDLRLPTDIVGLTTATYESDRSDSNYASWTAVASNQARRRIVELGSRTEPDTPARSVRREDERITEIKALDDEEVRDRDDQDEQTDESREQTDSGKDHEKAIERLQEKIEATDEEEGKRLLELQLGKLKALVNFNEGIKHLEDKIEEQPDDARGYFMLAWTYEDHELYDESLATLDKGLESATTRNLLVWFKAVLLSIVGEADEAKTLLRELIVEEPNYESSYTQLARILSKENERDAAKEAYESGLKALPNSRELLSGYASLLTELEENETALAAYRKLNNLYPDDGTYLTLMGNVYLNLDLNGLALEAYQSANEITDEKEGWIVANIGNLYKNRGFYPQAIEFLKVAHQLDPNSAYNAERLAIAIKLDQEEREKANQMVLKQKRIARYK